MRVKLLYVRQPLHHDPSAFCRVSLGGKCAQARIGRDLSGLVENTVRVAIIRNRKTLLKLNSNDIGL